MLIQDLTEDLIANALAKHSAKFVGIPTNMETYKFPFEQKAPKLPKFEKSNIATIK